MDKRMAGLVLVIILTVAAVTFFRTCVLGLSPFDSIKTVAWRNPGLAIPMTMGMLAVAAVVGMLGIALRLMADKAEKDEESDRFSDARRGASSTPGTARTGTPSAWSSPGPCMCRTFPIRTRGM